MIDVTFTNLLLFYSLLYHYQSYIENFNVYSLLHERLSIVMVSSCLMEID